MTQHRTPTRTARTLRAALLSAALLSAALLIAAVTSVGLLPAVAAAATPPTPDPATPSSITPTSAGRTSAGRTSAGPTSAGPTSAGTAAPPSAGRTSAGTPAPPSAGTGGQGRRVAVRPAAQTVTEGGTAVFTASLTPPPTTSPPVMIHWQTASAPTGPWTDLGGADGAVLSSTATREMNGDLYRAVATTGHVSATSPPAILHVQPVQPVPDPATTAGPPPNCPTPPPPIEPSTSCPDPTRSTPPLLPTASSTAVTATSPTADAPTPDNAVSPPTTGATYGTVALPVLQLGQEQAATGHNFTPATLVTVTLEPDGIDLGTYTVATDGTITTRFATTGLLAGTHTIRWTPA
jgi:hypothetical protein